MNLSMWVAYHLPKRVLYWATVRAAAYVSARPPHQRTAVSELKALDVLESLFSEDD